MACYEQFVTRQQRDLVPLLCFLLSRMGKQTGLYYIDSTSPPTCGGRPPAARRTRFATAATLINQMIEAEHQLQLGRAPAEVGAEFLFQLIAKRSEKAAVYLNGIGIRLE